MDSNLTLGRFFEESELALIVEGRYEGVEYSPRISTAKMLKRTMSKTSLNHHRLRMLANDPKKLQKDELLHSRLPLFADTVNDISVGIVLILRHFKNVVNWALTRELIHLYYAIEESCSIAYGMRSR